MNRLTMLQGMKVVDFSTFVAGPTCAKILGEYGADVIRVEPHIGDSVRYVARQMQGVTNGDNLLTDFQIVRASDRSYCDLIHRIIRNIRKRYRNHCKVFVFIISVYCCRISLAIDAGNRYGICSTYYMIVGSDQQIVIILANNNTGTTSLNFLLSSISLTSAESIISKIVLYILNRFCCDGYNGFHSFCCDIRNIKASFCLRFGIIFAFFII